VAPDTKLSNKAWSKIAPKFELPPHARNSFDGAISFFATTEVLQNPAHSPERTKRALRDIAGLSGKLRVGLEKLLSNPLAIVVMNKGGSIEGKSDVDRRTTEKQLGDSIEHKNV
jgi:hypothetical protein